MIGNKLNPKEKKRLRQFLVKKLKLKGIFRHDGRS